MVSMRRLENTWGRLVFFHNQFRVEFWSCLVASSFYQLNSFIGPELYSSKTFPYSFSYIISGLLLSHVYWFWFCLLYLLRSMWPDYFVYISKVNFWYILCYKVLHSYMSIGIITVKTLQGMNVTLLNSGAYYSLLI